MASYCPQIVTAQNSITDPTNLLGNTTESSFGTYVITWCQENHIRDGPEYIHCAAGGWQPNVPVCRGLNSLNEVEVTQDPWAYIVLGIIGGLLLIFFMIAICLVACRKRKQKDQDYRGLGKHRHQWGAVSAPAWFGRAQPESESSSERGDYHGRHTSKDKIVSHGDPRLEPNLVGRPWVNTIDRGNDTVDRYGQPTGHYRDDTYWTKYSNTHVGNGMRKARSDYQVGPTSLKPAVRAHSDFTHGYVGMPGAFGKDSWENRHSAPVDIKESKKQGGQIVTGTWMQRYKKWYRSNILRKDTMDRHSAPPAPIVEDSPAEVHLGGSPYQGRRIVPTEYFTDRVEPDRYYESRVSIDD